MKQDELANERKQSPTKGKEDEMTRVMGGREEIKEDTSV